MGRLFLVAVAAMVLCAVGCQGQEGNNEDTPPSADAPQLQQPSGDPAL